MMNYKKILSESKSAYIDTQDRKKQRALKIVTENLQDKNKSIII